MSSHEPSTLHRQLISERKDEVSTSQISGRPLRLPDLRPSIRRRLGRTKTTAYLADGSQDTPSGDVRFSWVLEGRAVQDLWITPAARRIAGTAWHDSGNRYSTTLRVYDPALDAWHILWINPPSGTILRQLGKRLGDEIVQSGEVDAEGRTSRWIYREITPESFRWCNEHSTDAGRTWTLVQEMRAFRV